MRDAEKPVPTQTATNRTPMIPPDKFATLRNDCALHFDSESPSNSRIVGYPKCRAERLAQIPGGKSASRR